METATQIRDAVAAVAQLRELHATMPALGEAVRQIKRFQSRRFAGSYAQLLQSPRYQAATRFFLDELYSDKDYSQRDAQFARIAGAIERFFPDAVAHTAAALAQLHALTEDLDQAMALAWLSAPQLSMNEPLRYAACWQAVGRRADRVRQLDVVLDIGREMAQLTRKPGLRTLLRMMRGPASAAGLASLQSFLEAGFDTFGAMARQPGSAEQFLQTIAASERTLIEDLFGTELVACGTRLERILGEAP
jgi:hypothetical protein